METMSSYGTVKPGPNDFLWSCAKCSALVADRERHDTWHRELASHSHHTLSVIGGPLPSPGAFDVTIGQQTGT
jgi:hypothetical protein